MRNFKRHPLSECFGTMGRAEQEALAADIKKNGQREKVILHENMVLDGWHRMLACQFLDIEPKTRVFCAADGNPVEFVLSANEHRRHRTGSERAASVAAVSEWAKAGRPETENQTPGVRFPAPGVSFFRTNAQMAALADTSEMTIKQAKAAVSAGAEVKEAVINGKISVKRGAEIAKLPPEERAAAVVKPPTPRKPPAPKPKPERTPEPDMVKELEEADKTIRLQQALIESLQKSDLAKEVAIWKGKFDEACKHVSQLNVTIAEASKSAKYYRGELDKIKKLVGVESVKDVAPAVLDLTQRK